MKKDIKIKYDEKIISNTENILGFQGEFRWLSNMVKIEPFEYDGDIYFSTENFYQAMKTLDKKERTKISKMTPKESKNYCKEIKKNIVIREDWESIKKQVMEYALRIKFSQNKFKKLLLLTNQSYIEETNGWNDIYWGVCSKTNTGCNHLGNLIMSLRKELQEGKNLLDKKFSKKKEKKEIDQTIVVNRKLEGYDVYIGRGTPFGNPYSTHTGEFTLDKVMEMYEDYFSKKIKKEPDFKKLVMSLQGKKLGCSCKTKTTNNPLFGTNDKKCHGDIIVKFITEELSNKNKNKIKNR